MDKKSKILYLIVIAVIALLFVAIISQFVKIKELEREIKDYKAAHSCITYVAKSSES